MQLQRTPTLVLVTLFTLLMALTACAVPASTNTNGNTGGAAATTPDASMEEDTEMPADSTPSSSSGAIGDLQGTWNVSAINGAPVAIASVPTMVFDGNGKVSGNASCNTYGGNYKADSSNLAFEGVVSTLMACADDSLNQQEAAFTGGLEQVATYTINGTALTLMDAEGNTVMELSRA